MRLQYGILVLTAFSSIAQAELNPGHTEQPIVVRIENASRARTQTLHFAEKIASDLFATAGVTIDWAGGRRPDVILVTLQEGAPDNYRPGAMAFARVFEGVHITVFYDRIAETGAPSHVLLAHVLVHEITHVLQGVDRHSARGIMKARWNGNEHMQMRLGTLAFTPDDIQLIHMGLAVRELKRRGDFLADFSRASACGCGKDDQLHVDRRKR